MYLQSGRNLKSIKFSNILIILLLFIFNDIVEGKEIWMILKDNFIVIKIIIVSSIEWFR